MIHRRAITPSYGNVLQILFSFILVSTLDILLRIRSYLPPSSSEVYGESRLTPAPPRFPVLASCVFAKTTMCLHLSLLLQFALDLKIKDRYTQKKILQELGENMKRPGWEGRSVGRDSKPGLDSLVTAFSLYWQQNVKVTWKCGSGNNMLQSKSSCCAPY
jgi:hypothetical protein